MLQRSPSSSSRPSQLSSWGWVGLAALILWQVYTTPVSSGWVISAAVLIILLAAIPAINWAKTQSQGLPAFELMMLTFVPFYAMPLLRGHPATLEYGEDTLLRATLAVVCFQAACLWGYRVITERPSRSRLWTESILAKNNVSLGRLGVIITTVFVYLLHFTDLLPPEFLSILRAMFFGIGTVSVFVVSRAWGESKLLQADKFLISGIVLTQLILVATQLYLITVASTVLMALIGYVTASRKIPLVWDFTEYCG